MAFASVGTLGSVNSKTANQAALVLTTTATLDAGNLGVIIYAVDNSASVDGDENAVVSVVDSAGNRWFKGREFTNAQTGAQLGAVCGIWYCRVATQLTSGGTITITFDSATTANRDASAATAWEFTMAANVGPTTIGSTVGTLATDAATLPGSLNLTTTNVAALRIRGLAYEGPIENHNSTVTASFTAFTENGTTGSVAAGNMTVWGEHIIATSTGTASNPATVSTSADWASVYVALQETDLLLGQAVL